MREAQELFCHECERYVRFTLDLSINGNYVLECPNCGHKHYRVVQDGKISDIRWGRDPSQSPGLLPAGTWTTVTATSTSVTSSYTDYGYSSGDVARSFLHDSWCNASSTTTY